MPVPAAEIGVLAEYVGRRTVEPGAACEGRLRSLARRRVDAECHRIALHLDADEESLAVSRPCRRRLRSP